MDHTNRLLARIEKDLTVSDDAMRSIPEEAADSATVSSARPYPYAEVTDAHSRQQAIEAGTLLAVKQILSFSAGHLIPVALTPAVWDDCVSWSPADSRRQIPQYEPCRLWELLFMAAQAAGRYRGEPRFMATLYRIPRGGQVRVPRPVQLLCTVGCILDSAPPGERVLTIRQPDEQ